MCCVIRIAGLSGGRGWSTSRIASVPPVDAPTITSFSELESGRRSAGAGAAAGACGAGARSLARGGADLVGDDLGVFEQAVADAQLGLGDEVDGAQLQRAQRDFAAALGQGRHHHHRHGPQAHQLFKEVQPVHARHFDVQRQHIRVVALDQFARHQRIGRGRDDLHVRLAVDDLCHQAAHQRGIVHTQDSDFLHFCRLGEPRPGPAFIDRLTAQAEILADVGEVFRMAREQQAARRAGNEPLQDPGLGRFVEIDHHVATEDGVELLVDGPGRRQQVQGVVAHHVRDLGPHPHLAGIGAAPFQEKRLSRDSSIFATRSAG